MIARIVCYTVGALAGVYLVNTIRPVTLNAAAAVDAAGGGIDSALSQLFAGHVGAAVTAVTSGAKAAGAQAKDQVEGQVRSNVILGVVGGCAVAGLVDALVLG